MNNKKVIKEFKKFEKAYIADGKKCREESFRREDDEESAYFQGKHQAYSNIWHMIHKLKIAIMETEKTNDLL